MWRDDLTEGILRHEFGGGLIFGGLIHGEAYFRSSMYRSNVVLSIFELTVCFEGVAADQSQWQTFPHRFQPDLTFS